ncbi:Glucanosyltransferase-domain-containing protein [Panaeolus papilionaceus]|nr:Glucanosyltransferase-domain-containing protein [Panaeolus papilionaceus]
MLIQQLQAIFALLTIFLTRSVFALPKITRTGKYLYDESGKRFFIKGIAYQEQGAIESDPNNDFLEPSDFIDPLALPDACRRDLPFLQELGVNTIRVYSVDSTLNHDDCMKLLSDAGIYVTIDLSLPLNGSIDRDVPAWSTNVLNVYTASIDTFEKYDNVLAYNIGNEVVVGTATAISPYVKAAARDIRAYLKAKGSKTLIGYSAINGAANWRQPFADYLGCDPSSGNSDSTSIDLFGLNNYEWCGSSGSYATTTNLFSDYNIALYFSEYGCIRNRPRTWAEVDGLFSADISAVWSGGIAFSYFPRIADLGDYGMVTLSADNKTVTPSDEFASLKTRYAAVTLVDTPAQSSAPAASYPTCPAADQVFLASTTLPGTPNADACACLERSLSCQFTVTDPDYSKKLGETIGVACNLLGAAGDSCDDIGGNGQTGTYGRVAGCHPLIKASYVMSKYYESTNRDPGACAFGGNGTVSTAQVPSGASALSAAASSCIPSPNAVLVPSAASTGTTPGGGNSGGGNGGNGGNGGGNGGNGGGNGGNGGNNNGGGTGGASGLIAGTTMLGLSVVTVVAVLSGVVLAV